MSLKNAFAAVIKAMRAEKGLDSTELGRSQQSDIRLETRARPITSDVRERHRQWREDILKKTKSPSSLLSRTKDYPSKKSFNELEKLRLLHT